MERKDKTAFWEALVKAMKKALF